MTEKLADAVFILTAIAFIVVTALSILSCAALPIALFIALLRWAFA